MVAKLTRGLEAKQEELLSPDPCRCYPRSAEDRAALQAGNFSDGQTSKVRFRIEIII